MESTRRGTMTSLAWTAAHLPVSLQRLGHPRCLGAPRHSGKAFVVHAVSSRASSRENQAPAKNNTVPGDGKARRTHVVIVGGGMAGLGCANSLKGMDTIDVTLLESTRLLGGRVRSKTALGALAWDTGAAYFTTKKNDGPWARVIDAALRAGVVKPWEAQAAACGDEDDPSTRDSKSMGTACVTTRQSDGRAVVDHKSFVPFGDSKKQLLVGVPNASAMPKFIAEQVTLANFPEASWVGDNRVSGVPQVLCGAHVDRVKELGDGKGKFWPVHPHGQNSSKKRWGFMTRCKEGGHMWYKPMECDVIVFACNAFTVAQLLREIDVGRNDGSTGNSTEKGSTDFGEVTAGEFSTVSTAENTNVVAEKTAAAVGRLTKAASKARGAPCWSLTAAFDSSLNLQYDALKLSPPFSGQIVWLANESSKPGRGRGQSAGWGYRWAEVGKSQLTTGTGECWAVHASPEWSAANLELSPKDAAKKLCAVFLSLVERDGPGDPKPVHCKATRWRFAFPTKSEDDEDDEDEDDADADDEKSKRPSAQTLGGEKKQPTADEPGTPPFLFEPSLGFGVCGDWLSGPRAGDAFESGAAIGKAVAKHVESFVQSAK